MLESESLEPLNAYARQRALQLARKAYLSPPWGPACACSSTRLASAAPGPPPRGHNGVSLYRKGLFQCSRVCLRAPSPEAPV